MAYCKECGTPVRERDTVCRVCGRAVEQIEAIDKSQVELVSPRASARADAVPIRIRREAFAVFDKRVAILVGLMLAMQALAFVMDRLENTQLSVLPLIGGALAIASACVLLAGVALRRCRLLLFGLGLLLVSFLVNVVFGCLHADFSTGVATGYWVCSLAVSAYVGAELATVFAELLTGTRHMGLHTALVCFGTLAILAHIVLAAIGGLTASVDSYVIARQLFQLLGKIFLLCAAFALFSNLERRASEAIN